MKKQFDLYKYLEEQMAIGAEKKLHLAEEKNSYEDFFALCEEVHQELNDQYKSDSQGLDSIRIQRGAIMGQERESLFYKDKIKQIILQKQKVKAKLPPWYKSLEDGVFAELFGFAGLTPWIYNEKPEYTQSTSAKVIGENIYFLLDGRCQLQTQKINHQRLDQLKRALLLGYPKERLESGVHEVYLNNGIRVTIFSGDIIKPGQDVIVFRKYVLKSLSFEKLASLGTIPLNSLPLFEMMATSGFNVLFSGPVRSGKTTFMQTWQSYEDKSLEGVSVATDTETDWSKIMGDAPFMQLVVDGTNMENVVKPLLRGDNDYIILEEMRDATAFNFAIDITSIGTRRTKGTIHSSRPQDIPYKMASKVAHKYGGDIEDIIYQIFKNFSFIFQMAVDQNNPGQRILDSITELCYDEDTRQTYAHTLCKYSQSEKSWKWEAASKRIPLERDIIGEETAVKIQAEIARLHDERNNRNVN